LDRQVTTIPTSDVRLTTSVDDFYGIEGLEGMGQRDVILPRWSVLQPASKKEGVAGMFYRNLDAVCQEALDVVVLKINPSRLLWSGELNEKVPECRSNDGVTGNTYGPCEQCHFNIWANPDLRRQLDEGKPVKVCNFGYNLLMADVADESLALLGAMGTSVRSIKVLASLFVQKRRSPFSAIVHIGTELQKNEKGKFYVLAPKITKWLDATETAKWRELYLDIKGQAIKEVEDVEDTPLGKDLL
jgi:hypothetical protein